MLLVPLLEQEMAVFQRAHNIGCNCWLPLYGLSVYWLPNYTKAVGLVFAQEMYLHTS